MAEFKIDGRMTVRKLKESFKNEFGGTLRVYNGRELADDAATLASIRKIDNVKVGDYICRASRTVGKFEEEMKEVFGIRVQVASPDDYILALDGITLANLKNIKEKATKADMEELVAYKRKEKNVVEGSEVDNDVCEEGVSEIDIYDIKPQDGLVFLNYDYYDDYEDIPVKNADDEDYTSFCAELFNAALSVKGDIENCEPVRYATCHDLLNGDGVYVEIEHTPSRWGGPGTLKIKLDSKVYIVKDRKILLAEDLTKYVDADDLEEWFDDDSEE